MSLLVFPNRHVGCCRNGVELGEGYNEIAASLKGKEAS